VLRRHAANAMLHTTTFGQAIKTYAAPGDGHMIPIFLPLRRRANLSTSFGLKVNLSLFALLPPQVCLWINGNNWPSIHACALNLSSSWHLKRPGELRGVVATAIE